MPSANRLGSILEKTGLCSSAQIGMLLDIRQRTNQSITDIMVSEGYATEEEFLETLAKAMKVPFVRLSTLEIEPSILQVLPTKAVFQYTVIPLSAENGVLRVATNDPFDPGMVDALRLASGMRVRLSLSPAAEIAEAAKKFYGVGADTVERMMQDGRAQSAVDETVVKDDLSELAEEASVVKFVNQIISEACKETATDIHFEPMESVLRIRYRLDGLLHEVPVPQQLHRFQAAIISRIKVMANMDIAEKRLPQDGSINLRIKGEDIDIRVSTMPTVYGESVSLRLLTRSTGLLGLGRLGMSEPDQSMVDRLIHRPNGILLVTGPTGSGKSTSLYAYLHTINSVDKRIITIEEPIEYEMAGINQIAVRTEIGLTFAVGLRHILRQDPDVIMVGEIRDYETAEVAIRASLTGHLVFSTLHTNDAAGAVTRLLDMGVEPYLVASSVEGIVAQRLVRTLCESCKQDAAPDLKFLESIGFPMDRVGSAPIFKSCGCDQCRTTGFRGRTGIYEILHLNDSIRPMIVTREPANAIKRAALTGGMRTLREDGWTKVVQGMTTLEEVLRVTEEDEF